MADGNLDLALRIRADMEQAVRSLNALEKELRETGSAAKDAGSSSSRAAGGIDKMDRAVDDAARSTKTLKRNLDEVPTAATRTSEAMGKLRNILLGAFVGQAIVSFTRQLVTANVEAQRIHYTLEQVFGNEAASQFRFVTDESERLGLNLQVAAEGYASLAASAQGTAVSTATLQKLFVGLSESATVLHSSEQDINGVMMQLAQAISLGKLQMQDIRAIAQHLPGTMTLITQALHQMGLSMDDALKDGGIDAVQFLDHFADVLHDRFGVQAVAASHSLNAEIQRLRGTIFEAETQGNSFADSFASAIRGLNTELEDPQLREGLKDLIEGLGNVANAAVEAAGKIGQAMEGIAGIARYAAFLKTGYIDQDQSPAAQYNEFQALVERREKIKAAIAYYGGPDSNQPIVKQYLRELATVTAQLKANQELHKQAEQAEHPGGADAGTVLAGDQVPDWMTGRDPRRGGTTKPPTPPTDPNAAKERAAALAKVQETATKAQDALTQALIRAQTAMDPTAEAYARYNDQVRDAKEWADAAKQATGANTEAIDAQRDAVIAGAKAELDAAKQKIEARRLSEQDSTVSDLLGNAPGGYRVPPEIGGAAGELLQLQQRMVALDQWHMKVSQANEIFRMEDLRNEQKYQENLAQIDQLYRERKAAADQAAHQLSLAAAEEGFGSLANAMASFYGQQSAQYRAAFVLQKTAALVHTIMNIKEAASTALAKSGNPWLGFANMALIISQGAELVAAIRGVSFSGGGWTGPGGKYQPAGIVHADEGVLTKEDMAALGGPSGFDALRDAIRNGYADGGVVQNPFAAAPSPAALGFRSQPATAVNAGKLMVAVTPVTVIVHGGSDDVKSQQSTDSDGGQVLELFLGAVAKNVQDGGVVAQAADRRWILQRKSNSYG